jgi:uncharacterized protein YecE (DUF72 family)
MDDLKLPFDHAEEIASRQPPPARISDLIRFGTSTWTYEGWQGQVYKKTYPKSRFKQDCLAEYAQYTYHGAPLFRTVGIDHTFYGPPTPRMLDNYAAQLPPGFQACAKVWEDITVPVFPSGLRYAKKAGPNRHFLDAQYFMDMVLAPFDQAFRDHTGPFILEFQRSGLDVETFLPKLDRFLERVPTRYEYAIEVRNPRIIGDRYRAILEAHGAAHIYNHYTALPSLLEQHAALEETFTAPFTVMRLLTPRNTKYHEAVKAYRPYNKIVKPQPEMRQETVTLLKQAERRKRRAYVLVNNRAEGNAPLTVQALVEALQGEAPR